MATGSETLASIQTADPMLPRFLRVRGVLKETHDTITLKLDDSKAAPRFAPGQFNMLYRFGAGEIAISISGAPDKPETLVHTIRGVGSVTAPLLRARRGDVLGVRGPYGSAWPLDEALTGSDLLLLAGGIGLAPLRPVIYEVLRRRRDFGNLIILHGARTPSDVLYRKELSQWRTYPGVTVKLIVDRATAGWSGRVGVITDLLGAVQFDPAETIAMACGPRCAADVAAADDFTARAGNRRTLAIHAKFPPTIHTNRRPPIAQEIVIAVGTGRSLDGPSKNKPSPPGFNE